MAKKQAPLQYKTLTTIFHTGLGCTVPAGELVALDHLNAYEIAMLIGLGVVEPLGAAPDLPIEAAGVPRPAAVLLWTRGIRSLADLASADPGHVGRLSETYSDEPVRWRDKANQLVTEG